ncbi:MAG: hypothetical protein Q9N32_00115 [Gammaproteobacteria bacterium]|nr:hypothetical protein [Gammaproteobacteria bacterium]
MNEFVDAENIVLLGSALAIGLLIGVERGWRSREVKKANALLAYAHMV